MPRSTATQRNTRFDVTSVGETMLRFSGTVGARLSETDHFSLHVGGAESNVCSTLAQLGRRCAWYSRVPANPLGDRVISNLSRHGIDTGAVERADAVRLGLYFVADVADRTGRTLVYDRSGSAASHMHPDSVPWHYVTDARLLHLTGITPALSNGCRDVVSAAVERAKAADVAVSLDVNYRPQLWSPAQARAALAPIAEAVDLLVCAVRDARTVFGITGDDESVLWALAELSSADWIVLTLGAEGVIATDREIVVQQASIPAQVVDTIGGGDALTAGVIDGWLDGCVRTAVKRGAVLAAMALEQAGDMPTVSRADLERRIGASDSATSPPSPSPASPSKNPRRSSR